LRSTLDGGKPHMPDLFPRRVSFPIGRRIGGHEHRPRAQRFRRAADDNSLAGR
jgi:hypothetical protein